MTDYLNLPLGEKAPEIANVVIEIPLESVNKYEYDKKLNVFRLDRNLYSPVHFPGDYGFFPSTLSLDGDPLENIRNTRRISSVYLNGIKFDRNAQLARWKNDGASH